MPQDLERVMLAQRFGAGHGCNELTLNAHIIYVQAFQGLLLPLVKLLG